MHYIQLNLPLGVSGVVVTHDRDLVDGATRSEVGLQLSGGGLVFHLANIAAHIAGRSVREK
jgi:hypothetical protein